MKIIILDAHTVNPGDLSWHPLDEIGELTIYPRTKPDNIIERCHDAEIVLTNKVVFNSEILNQLPRLEYIGVLATGYNVVDLETATRQNIVVTNIPAYSTQSVAQMVWAHILNITNRVSYYSDQNRQGRWNNSPDFCYYDFTHTELSGKTIGIIGLGNTGMAVARIAMAFEMKVLAYTSKTSLPDGINKADMETLFRQSDILSLHCPLNDTTRNLVNRERLAMMKPSAILINASRGPVVDEQAVAQALETHTLAAFAADVLSTEPPSHNNPLLTAPNTYITPHIAWATLEARKRLINTAISNIQAFINGKPQNRVI